MASKFQKQYELCAAMSPNKNRDSVARTIAESFDTHKDYEADMHVAAAMLRNYADVLGRANDCLAHIPTHKRDTEIVEYILFGDMKGRRIVTDAAGNVEYKTEEQIVEGAI